jgi:hypothetical protein
MQEIKRHGDSALTFFPRQPPIVLLQPFFSRATTALIAIISYKSRRIHLSKNRSVRPILSVRTSPVRARDPSLRTA